MNTLRAGMEDYLATRRALGFKLERHGDLLADFVGYCERQQVDTVTLDIAFAWATAPGEADPSWWAARLAVVRCFARWQIVFDPHTQVPPADALPAHSRRADPYPYTDQDVERLIVAAGELPSPLRAATYQMLIGLLTVTGLRVGEAIGLDRSDVDLDEGLLVVRRSKFDRSREVPLHPSSVSALDGYRQLRDNHLPHPATPAFFVSLAGTRLIYNNVHRVFHDLVQQIGLQPRSPRCRPRIHDLRHHFAVTTLLTWYREGADLQARLPELSAYLGHLSPKDTYWYLRAAPELMTLAAGRLEAQEARR
jgi:integrase/recombinase XerD